MERRGLLVRPGWATSGAVGDDCRAGVPGSVSAPTFRPTAEVVSRSQSPVVRKRPSPTGWEKPVLPRMARAIVRGGGRAVAAAWENARLVRCDRGLDAPAARRRPPDGGGRHRLLLEPPDRRRVVPLRDAGGICPRRKGSACACTARRSSPTPTIRNPWWRPRGARRSRSSRTPCRRGSRGRVIARVKPWLEPRVLGPAAQCRALRAELRAAAEVQARGGRRGGGDSRSRLSSPALDVAGGDARRARGAVARQPGPRKGSDHGVAGGAWRAAGRRAARSGAGDGDSPRSGAPVEADGRQPARLGARAVRAPRGDHRAAQEHRAPAAGVGGVDGRGPGGAGARAVRPAGMEERCVARGVRHGGGGRLVAPPGLRRRRTRWRRSIDRRWLSSARRATRASACRWSRRWPPAFPCWRATSPCSARWRVTPRSSCPWTMSPPGSEPWPGWPRIRHCATALPRADASEPGHSTGRPPRPGPARCWSGRRGIPGRRGPHPCGFPRRGFPAAFHRTTSVRLVVAERRLTRRRAFGWSSLIRTLRTSRCPPRLGRASADIVRAHPAAVSLSARRRPAAVRW